MLRPWVNNLLGNFGFLLLLDERVECTTYAFALIHACVAMATIYLSSTYEDLKEYRRVVCKTLRTIGGPVMYCDELK